MISPRASTAPGYRMTTAPPGRGSIDEPSPHHDAQRAESVKNRNTVSRRA
jgi:hypothetical protein